MRRRIFTSLDGAALLREPKQRYTVGCVGGPGGNYLCAYQYAAKLDRSQPEGGLDLDDSSATLAGRRTRSRFARYEFMGHAEQVPQHIGMHAR
jgi:hypothetical protein